MKRLLPYLGKYKKETILGPLFKLLEASFELFVPLVVATIVDKGIPNKDISYISRMCFVLVVLGLIGLVCSVTAQYFAAKAAVGFSTKLRSALFAHIQSFSFTEVDEQGTSTLITRMTSDINQVQSGLNLTLRLLLRSPFVVFGAMIMAFTIDTKMALVFVITIPILCIVVFGIMLITIPMFRMVQQRLDSVLGATRQNLTGARVIRAFCKEEEEIQQFQNKNQDLTKIQKKVGSISGLMNPLTYSIINIAIIILIWEGAIQVELGLLTQGMVIALYNYMSQILVELVKLANLIISITKSIACAKRITGIFEIESSMKDGNKKNEKELSEERNLEYQNCDNVVEFDNVSITYHGSSEESLSNISFVVKRGETIGIIGGTGSGKSTLVHLIPRFYDATKGKIMIFGKEIKEYSLVELRDHIGIVLQKATLFKGSIRENMQWGKEDAIDDEIMQSLEIAQAKEVVQGKEGELDFQVTQGGKNLSGGQRQRLTIARALVKRPDIIILDDSASALDYATDARLRKSLKEMEGESTIFIVSQRTSSIQFADHIIVLEDGQMVGYGTHEELLRQCEVYQEIHYSQYEKESKA